MDENTMQKKIAVVGAAGFVGRELLRAFHSIGTRVTAVSRAPAVWVTDYNQHDVIGEASLSHGPSFDIVINLAYPTGGAPHEYPALNKAIFSLIEKLLKPNGHLIHVSTQAVFGLALDRPSAPIAVAKFRDDAYVEAKIEAEHYLTHFASARAAKLDIVRLGNVWGRYSGAWALPIVHKLITGRPVGVAGSDADSSVTDVTNVASYLVFLANKTSAGAPAINFHHLCEFSAVKWSEWINPIAKELGVIPQYAEPEQVQLTYSLTKEIQKGTSSLGPRKIYQRFAFERIAGSYLRSILRLMPKSKVDKLKDTPVYYTPEIFDIFENSFLTIVSAKQALKNHTDPAWSPPVKYEESIGRVISWIRNDQIR